MKYKNLANNNTTNIFETLVGALNIAPTKISGQYKIVVTIDGKLYLDDYTGRRVPLDISKNFLPQVSNFLKLNNFLGDLSSLRYGAFQKSTKKYFHIPLYLGSKDVPKYYVLSRVVNETIKDVSKLYNYGQIQQVIDLEKIGLYKIFNEIFAQEYFNFPVYFNWQNNLIDIYGYSVLRDCCAISTFDLVDSQANQPYFQVLNNTILNKFSEEKIFFPRFLNLEFEFEYENDYIPFNNFYGFLSTSEDISKYDSDYFCIKLKDYFNNKITWSQIKTNNISLEPYTDIVGSGSLLHISEQLPQYKFQTNRLSQGDKITITHPNGEIDFEYVVKSADINLMSLFESLKNVCRNAQNQSISEYLFTVKKIESIYEITIVSNNIDILFDDYTISAPLYFKVIDRFVGASNYNKFRGITVNDVHLAGNPNLLDNQTSLMINGTTFQIIEKFKFDSKSIIRLDKPSEISMISECKIFQNKIETAKKLIPIQCLNFYSNLKSELPYEQNKYISELITNFGANDAITKFAEASNHNESLFQYIIEDSTLNELQDLHAINLENYNIENCLNMIFNSSGNTSYITPNTLNIDKQFYLQNGCLDVDLLDEDSLRYNWFLIKGKCPEYLKNDIRELRYFDTLPKITSRLIKVSESYCETVFLGVKYQLPLKYKNFQFAVYLNFNDKNDAGLNYKYIVDNEQKTIYLTINKYLDFVDLIRGGSDTNEALLDLSFFYSVNNSFNNNSEYLGDFKSSIIKLCDEFKTSDESIYFNGNEIRDWKYQNPDDGKWYIALRRELSSNENKINDFRMLFDIQNPNPTFYVYSSITASNGIKYEYPSMVINIKNIAYVGEKYLWCEDVSIKFFDTQEIFVKLFNETTKIDDIFSVDKNNIFNLTNSSGVIFADYTKTGTIVVDALDKQFQLITPDKTISLREYYFEINQNISEDLSGVQTLEKNVFKFPECTIPLNDSEIINQFDFSINTDYAVAQNKINLFSRNQIWRIVQDLFKVDLKFKFLSKDMVRKLMNKFMITNLIDYSNVNSLEILNSSGEFVKFNVVETDKNIAIWDVLGVKKINLLNRERTAYLPYMEMYDNIINFQLPQFKKYNTLFNIYEENFGGFLITATGIWNEVQGNIVSSLYCKMNDILITTPFFDTINYKKLFMDSLDIEKIIINNFNENYITKINKNVNEYILESYTDYLLKKFFRLDSITNEFNERLEYVIDNQNQFLINIKSTKIFNTLTLVFKRK